MTTGSPDAPAGETPPPEDPRLRAVAEACDWVMRFPCRTAPGLVFVGARSEPAEVWGDPALKGIVGGHAGGGETPEAAFAACMGEAAEFLCQFERPGDLSGREDALPEAEALAGWTPPDGARVRAARMVDGAPCALPAARVLRRAGETPPFRLGTGCAAGATPEAARLAALLEAIERDAAALWWRGGRPARALDLTNPALAEAAARIAAWRAGAEAPRVCWALRLEAVAGVPVIAALTTDPEGRDLSVGVAARATAEAALLAAAREAVQGELALDLIAERRAVHGEAVLGQADRDRLALAALDPARTPALMPAAPPGGPSWRPSGRQPGDLSSAAQPPGEIHRDRAEPRRASATGGADSATMLKALVETPALAQHSPACVDLTRPRFRLPVAFVAAARLQPFPAEHATPRLAEAMEAAGGRGPEAPLF